MSRIVQLGSYYAVIAVPHRPQELFLLASTSADPFSQGSDPRFAMPSPSIDHVACWCPQNHADTFFLLIALVRHRPGLHIILDLENCSIAVLDSAASMLLPEGEWKQ